MPVIDVANTTPPSGGLRILISGVGNVLRQDDGFGIEVARRLLEQGPLPEGVKAMETGIGGIHLVQELMGGYDALLLLDAVSRGGKPGQLYLLETEVADLDALSFDERSDFLADMHYTNPVRALMLAKALKVLPAQVYVLGCQTARHDDFAIGLSAEVEAAIPKAITQLLEWVETLTLPPLK